MTVTVLCNLCCNAVCSLGCGNLSLCVASPHRTHVGAKKCLGPARRTVVPKQAPKLDGTPAHPKRYPSHLPNMQCGMRKFVGSMCILMCYEKNISNECEHGVCDVMWPLVSSIGDGTMRCNERKLEAGICDNVKQI